MSCVIVFVLLVLIPSNSRAELKTICFYEDDAAEIVVQLENYDKQIELVIALKAENEELAGKTESLARLNDIQEKQLQDADNAVKKLNGVIETHKDAYEKQIKEITPGFFQKMFTALSGVGIGILIGVLL